MKRIKRMVFMSILVCALTALTGCGKGEKWERWAYIHDTETEILRLGSDAQVWKQNRRNPYKYWATPISLYSVMGTFLK